MILRICISNIKLKLVNKERSGGLRVLDVTKILSFVKNNVTNMWECYQFGDHIIRLTEEELNKLIEDALHKDKS